MSASLCDAALGIENSGRMIAALERDSLFIVALNGDGEWYRYHDLFRELLESEMQRQSPDLVAGILRRAAAWHHERGDTREAFEYAYTSGDLERAGRILLRSGESLIARGQIETVRGWMGRCTREQMGSNPQLALAGAWIALLSGEAAEASRLAAVAETAGDLDVPSADGATSLRSSLANLRATLAADGISQMLRDAEFVVKAERRAGTRWIMDGWRGVATAHLLSGNPGQAIKAFAQVLALTRGRTDLNFITVNCLGYSALAAADAGDWRRARKWARDARAMSAESGLDDVLQSTAAYTAHAAVLLHDGLLPQAGKALDHVRRLLPMLHALRWFEADISLRCADISLDLGDTDAGLDLADIARAALDLYPNPGKLRVRLTALDARLSSGGDLELTPSELRLVPFLPSHLSLQEIGDRLFLSRATVKTHTDSIYRRLGVASRSSAVERLEELGLAAGPSA
jgi:LuxR family maltose regulon positive regulatory protein